MTAVPDERWGTAAAGAQCSTITFLPASLPDGAPGVPYSKRIVATGGDGPYAYSLFGGSLPPGLTLTSAGYLEGAPTTLGSYTFVVRALDANFCTGSRSYTIVVDVCPMILLNPSRLPDATAGASYSYSVSASGGLQPYRFSLFGSTLPPGLTLSPTGSVTGIPTAPGDYTFVMRALDANFCLGSRSSSITVTCPTINILGPAQFNATVGIPYDNSYVGLGGTAPYTFSVVLNAMPPGLTLFPSGAFSGTPTAAGSYTFSILATDANGCTGFDTNGAEIAACPKIDISPSTLPSGALAVPYSQTITPSGGTAPYSVVLSSGMLPTGLEISATGVLSGKPAAFGTFDFSLKVTAANGCGTDKSYSLTIRGVPTSAAATPTHTPTGAPALTPIAAPTYTHTTTQTATRMPTGTFTPTRPLAWTATGTRTSTASPTATRTPSSMVTPTRTSTRTFTHTVTLSATATATASLSLTPETGETAAPTATSTWTRATMRTATTTGTSAPSPTASPTTSSVGTATRTASATATGSAVPAGTMPAGTAGATPTASATTTSSIRSTATETPPASASPTSNSPVATASPTPTPTSTPPAVACTGDCDGSGEVRVDELVRGVNMALGRDLPAHCPAFDPNHSGLVEINELVDAVGHALRRCP